MWRYLLLRSPFILVLSFSAAAAKERDPVSRDLYLHQESREGVQPVYVAGGMGTILRFAQPVDLSRTKMLGWEGRFEPLLVGKRLVVVMPLQEVASEDRFLLVVTLQDGKEIPFTITAQKGRFDHQVNVFPDKESAGALWSRLAFVEEKQRDLEEDVERMRGEETSIDHSLAGLLAKDAVKLTPFRPRLEQLFKNPNGVELRITVLVSRDRDKVAVLYNVKNNSRVDSWSLLEGKHGS